MSHIPVFTGTSFVREANYILLLTSHTVLPFRICKIWASFSFLHPLLTRVVHLKCLYSKFCRPPFLGFLGLPPSPQFVLIILAISSNPCCAGSILSLEASSLITFFHFLCPWAALWSPQTSPLQLFFSYLGGNLKAKSDMLLIKGKFMHAFSFPQSILSWSKRRFLNLRHGSLKCHCPIIYFKMYWLCSVWQYEETEIKNK